MVLTSWNIAGIIGYLILCIIISFLASDDEKSGFMILSGNANSKVLY